MRAYIKAQTIGPDPVRLIGIDAGEPHRARVSDPGEWEKKYPLVDLGIDRKGCVDIIKEAGLCVPVKSGCWHCPFMRVAEVLTLAREAPERLDRIEALEDKAWVARGSRLAQWGDKPASYWRDRAALPMTADLDWDDEDEGEPCECYR